MMGAQDDMKAAAVAERKVLLESGGWRWWLASALFLLLGFFSAMCLFRWSWGSPVAMGFMTFTSLIAAALCQHRAVKVEMMYREKNGVGG